MNKSKKIKTIGIVFNLKSKNVTGDQHEEYDEIETILNLKNELSKYGFKVILLEQNSHFLNRLVKTRPDFVFNIAEGLGHGRWRESQVPAVLENLGIPYSGSDPLTMGLTLDKYLTNVILAAVGIPVPLMFMVTEEKEIARLKNIFLRHKYYLVKPRWEGSSKGIFLNSKVNNLKDLKNRVRTVLRKYKQPALIEEFLEKEEITVGVGGNKPPRILGMMKIVPKNIDQEHFLYSIEVKRDWQRQVQYDPEESIPPKTRRLIKNSALAAFKALELRDIARVDFRLDRHHTPKIIDINPLPGLSPSYSDLPILYKLKGGTYSQLVKIILTEALKRYKLLWNE